MVEEADAKGEKRMPGVRMKVDEDEEEKEEEGNKSLGKTTSFYVSGVACCFVFTREFEASMYIVAMVERVSR